MSPTTFEIFHPGADFINTIKTAISFAALRISSISGDLSLSKILSLFFSVVKVIFSSTSYD